MALINDIYVFIESESVRREAQVSQHPVEEGIDLTDHVRRSPVSLSLAGAIVGEDYENDVLRLDELHRTGELVEYVGVNLLSDAIIASFTTEHTGETKGGCWFTMEICEVRITASPFVAGSGNAGTQQIEEGASAAEAAPAARTYVVQNGDTLWHLAEAYYGNGSQFTVIFNANRDKLSDPDVIAVGQVLVIP